MVVTVNNDDSDFVMTVSAGNAAEYVGALSGQKVRVENGTICVNVKANAGEIWLPVTDQVSDELSDIKPVEFHVTDAVKDTAVSVEEAPSVANIPESEMPVQKSPKEPAVAEDRTEVLVASAETSEEFEKGKIAGLQEAIIAIMEKNGPVTDQMRKDVTDNVYHDSLITWIKSFR